ncbi:HAMP domain-containing histidine kinase [Vibrio sp. D404a]|uniref:sensor histidine kinase n=1 Tax=unclassified Vibrio TaxID=2614977 RepID=UPI002555B29C|nr:MULTISPECIES: sensor histidine kinase [unclassified Vibrio]MDK9737396.1 HAMP domain-containing histidine kinase [Vibrio sp. D404a]MDK9797928.1 HAMP domain-containing histidine kinase [Vibrio sp. D449a]
MSRLLFWRLFIVLSCGVVIFFSLLHSAAILSNEKMSYINKIHQKEILAWGNTAQEFLTNQQYSELDIWLDELAETENTWVTVVQSGVDVIAGNELNQRFWEGYGIGRNVEWKIHLDFPENPIMEVALSPSNYHFLVILPDRMRPGTYMSHAFWLFRFIIPFATLLALTIYLYRYVMRPLQQFHQATQAFSKGHYSARIPTKLTQGNDEFSQIARTFNTMAEQTSNVITHNRNLISDMSHEIRTPIARIETAIDCLEQNIKPDAMMTRIKGETKNMRELAEDTLTLAWIENENPDLRQESFDLIELLEAIVDDAQFEFVEKRIVMNTPDALPIQNSNQRALGHAIENILRNGLRYTPDGESLTINIKQNKSNIVLTLTDSGPGLDPQLCDKIFTPFFKAHNQVGSRKGFGVGLALARRHIEAVKGSVWASNAPDKGLCVSIRLPT